MALVKITPKEFSLNKESYLPGTTAVTSTTDGCEVPFVKEDAKILLLFENSSAAATVKATIKAGDGPMAKGEDIEITLAASGAATIVLESGLFKNHAGTHKDAVFIVPSTTTLKVAAIVMP